MKRQKKDLLCQEYAQIINKSPLVLVMHYNNLVNNYVDLEYVKQMLIADVQRLYVDVKKEPEVRIKVIKNSLIKHTIKSTIFQNLTPLFSGPTLLLYADIASVHLSQIISQWKKSNSHLQILGGKFENSLISTNDFQEITYLLPRKEDVLGQTVGILESSIINITNTLNEGPNRFHQTMKEYSALSNV